MAPLVKGESMKRIIVGLFFLAPVALAGWYLGGYLSRDSLALGLGVIFGVMTGIPMALIALAADRVRRVRVDHVHIVESPKKAHELQLPRVSVVYPAIAAKALQRPALPAQPGNSDWT